MCLASGKSCFQKLISSASNWLEPLNNLTTIYQKEINERNKRATEGITVKSPWTGLRRYPPISFPFILFYIIGHNKFKTFRPRAAHLTTGYFPLSSRFPSPFFFWTFKWTTFVETSLHALMVPLTQSSMERGLDDWKGGKAMATKELS